MMMMMMMLLVRLDDEHSNLDKIEREEGMREVGCIDGIKTG